MIDIIIPVYNEAEILRKRREYFFDLGKKANLIFVDGASDDQTIEVAKQYGRVVSSERGRGVQKNKGADCSTSDIMLLLHVDTKIDESALNKVEQVMQDKQIAGGHFTLSIDDSSPVFVLFAGIVNFRARVLKVIDGDCGLFVSKVAFLKAGGFDHLPYMEDLLFSRKLRKVGKVVSLKNPILVSSRKWRQQGFIKTFLRYTWAYVELWTKFRFNKEHNQCLKLIRKPL